VLTYQQSTNIPWGLNHVTLKCPACDTCSGAAAIAGARGRTLDEYAREREKTAKGSSGGVLESELTLKKGVREATSIGERKNCERQRGDRRENGRPQTWSLSLNERGFTGSWWRRGPGWSELKDLDKNLKTED